MFNQDYLNEIFPAERTDMFFEALFGGAEDGAYDISLTFNKADEKNLSFFFELRQRPGHCLRCNLTTGLPQVFSRHPILGVNAVAQALAEKAGFAEYTWNLGQTIQYSEALHAIPLTIQAK